MAPPRKNPQKRVGADLLESELTFYGCYHSHPGNQVIHFLFVPPIMATLCVWLAYARPADAPSLVPSIPGAVLNPALLMVAAYSWYYTALEPFAGSTWTLLQALPMWLGATAARAHYPTTAWKWAVVLHVLSWLIQVGLGHGLIERRRPALTVSLSQALSSAALFAWLEGLFFVGYRPDLKARLDARVAVEQAGMERRRRRGLRG